MHHWPQQLSLPAAVEAAEQGREIFARPQRCERFSRQLLAAAVALICRSAQQRHRPIAVLLRQLSAARGGPFHVPANRGHTAGK